MAAELTRQNIIDKIAALDASIATITDSLTAKHTDHEVGEIAVKGSQQLEQLMKTREMYQKLANAFPAESVNDSPLEIEQWGEDNTDYVGDE